MVRCPHCQFSNTDRADLCAGCGGSLLALPSIALPAPMVEPINTPTKPPPDSKPLSARPVLTEALDENSSVTVASPSPGTDNTPAPVTILSLPPRFLPNNRHAPGGTNPAHPGLPGHPMNDSALENPPTIPATHKADHAPTPVPAAQSMHPKLVVLRGMRISAEYPIYEGRNTIGRFADKPVDIDLMSQESVEQIWCSRQHAVIVFEQDVVTVEDCNSLNGTWVNGVRLHPGQRRQLKPGDIIQVGTVQMKLLG
jgi:FHA domain